MTGLRNQINAWMARSSNIEAELIREQGAINTQKATLATREAKMQAWESNKFKLEAELAKVRETFIPPRILTSAEYGWTNANIPKAKQNAAQSDETRDKILAGQKTLLDTALQTERLLRVNRDALEAENETLKQTCQALQAENTQLKEQLGRLETEAHELLNERNTLQIEATEAKDLLLLENVRPMNLLD